MYSSLLPPHLFYPRQHHHFATGATGRASFRAPPPHPLWRDPDPVIQGGGTQQRHARTLAHTQSRKRGEIKKAPFSLAPTHRSGGDQNKKNHRTTADTLFQRVRERQEARLASQTHTPDYGGPYRSLRSLHRHSERENKEKGPRHYSLLEIRIAQQRNE